MNLGGNRFFQERARTCLCVCVSLSLSLSSVCLQPNPPPLPIHACIHRFLQAHHCPQLQHWQSLLVVLFPLSTLSLLSLIRRASRTVEGRISWHIQPTYLGRMRPPQALDTGLRRIVRRKPGHLYRFPLDFSPPKVGLQGVWGGE